MQSTSNSSYLSSMACTNEINIAMALRTKGRLMIICNEKVTSEHIDQETMVGFRSA